MESQCGFKRNIRGFIELVGEIEWGGMSVAKSIEAFFKASEVAAIGVFFEKKMSLVVFEMEEPLELFGSERSEGA